METGAIHPRAGVDGKNTHDCSLHGRRTSPLLAHRPAEYAGCRCPACRICAVQPVEGRAAAGSAGHRRGADPSPAGCPPALPHRALHRDRLFAAPGLCLLQHHLARPALERAGPARADAALSGTT
ncbi:hypothetical protein G6F50_017179 [Rhizopus delemar]|uniref:Uncharacterized protein n=1 Tax=Rhizopus delemar TaxID=936053 RepID=A0A9P6XR49_9FUNG|nr:hypothetical protein G6F50_017179 [Rhizopus delemar]